MQYRTDPSQPLHQKSSRIFVSIKRSYCVHPISWQSNGWLMKLLILCEIDRSFEWREINFRKKTFVCLALVVFLAPKLVVSFRQFVPVIKIVWQTLDLIIYSEWNLATKGKVMKWNVEAQKAFSAFVVFEPCHEGLSGDNLVCVESRLFSLEGSASCSRPINIAFTSGFYDNSMSCIISNET